MKDDTAIEIIRVFFSTLQGYGNVDVKWIDNYETDHRNEPVRALQIGNGDGSFWIWPDQVEVSRRNDLLDDTLGKAMVDGFKLEALCVDRNYPHEPDDYYTKVIAEERHFPNIVSYLVGEIFSQRMQDHHEWADFKLSDEEFEEYEKEIKDETQDCETSPE